VVRRAAVEALGSAFLLAAVVGSGIIGERLAAGNTAIALRQYDRHGSGAALLSLTAGMAKLDAAS
jgi:hypothetical protein